MNIMTYAFGVGALVSLTPIITVQLLGIFYDNRLRRLENNKYDETIVEYVWES